MNLAWWLNTLGLLLATGAALLMYYCPTRVQLYTEKGDSVVTWTRGTPSENMKRRGQLQIALSRIAPLLLAFGFLLQLAGILLPLCDSR